MKNTIMRATASAVLGGSLLFSGTGISSQTSQGSFCQRGDLKFYDRCPRSVTRM